MLLRFCAALLGMMGMTTAAAQMVASHAPTAPMPKMTAAPSVAKAVMAPAKQVSTKPVARVKGVELTERDLMREMFTIFPYAQQHNGFPKELEPEIRRGALEMIIFEELVYQEAKRRNMSIPPAKLTGAEAAFRKQFPSQAAYKEFLKSETNGSEAAMREKIRRALLIESMLNLEVNNPSRVTTALAKAYYDKNSSQYKHGEIFHIQSISMIAPNETKAVLKEAKQRADEALKHAKTANSYRDFGLLAERLSDDDFHVNMGDHKPREAKDLPPPIAQAAATMKPGDVSDLIHFDNNYTIIRLEGRTPAGTTPFAEVKAKLQSEMQKEKTQQLRSALGQKLRRKAKIEVF